MTMREKALKAVQMYHFALHEANLFLDTHPHNKQALEYFRKVRAMYKKAYDEYVMKFGPLQAVDSECMDSFEWIKGPWPWENESDGDK